VFCFLRCFLDKRISDFEHESRDCDVPLLFFPQRRRVWSLALEGSGPIYILWDSSAGVCLSADIIS